jgi:transposase-like protein
MPNSLFDANTLRSEEAALAYIEGRVWPNGRVCPHCGVVDRSGKLENQRTKPSKRHPNGKPVIGFYKCYACRKPFTVRVGTIFEDSHVPLHLWLQAIVLMCSSKKGISTNQLHRMLGVTLRTAWHMSHRIRLMMAPHTDVFGPIGGEGKTLEVDETFIGKKADAPSNPWQFNSERGWHRARNVRSGDKLTVVTLVERGGEARSFVADGTTTHELREIILAQADTKSALMTDQWRAYLSIGRQFASHETVNHSEEEWVRGDVHTNTVEGFFSVFKRGMRGVYQHCDERHLHRYLAEFDFRYSNRSALGIEDSERAALAVQGAVGKRLTYRTTRGETSAQA